MKHKPRPSRIFILLGFILTAHTAIAQPLSIRFQHLSVEQGLSANLLYAITQDNRGFMWLGTNEGLNRFDGKNVEVFRYKHGDKYSLPHNASNCLFTDSRGIVWIGTINGLAYYDEHSNSFRSFISNPKDNNSLPGNIINAISEDNRGLLWIGTGQDGLCSFDVKNNRFRRFSKNDHANSISDNRIRDIKRAPDGTMWIATGNGLNRLDVATMTFTAFYQNQADSATLSSNSLQRIAIDKDGNVWTTFVSEYKLHVDCLNTKTFRCKRFITSIERQPTSSNALAARLPRAEARSLLVDKRGRIWIGSPQSGLSLFVPNRNFLYQNKLDALDPTSLQSNSIKGIYQDHSGMIWLATGAGAERFNPDESKFILYRGQAIGSFSPAQKSIQAFAEDTSHRLWIGTSEGLYIWDRNTDEYKQYRLDQTDTSELSANFITAICRDPKGNMWLGTTNGVKLFEPVPNKVVSFYSEQNNYSLAGNIISCIVCEKNGDLLIASRSAIGGGSAFSIGSRSGIGGLGLSIYNTQTNRFVNFHNDTSKALLNKATSVVFEDNSGIIWLGTEGRGLIRYNRNSGELKNFTNVAGDTSSLASVYVSSITQDHKGVIWVGTNAGLSHFNENTQSFTTFTDKNGLPSVRIKQLLVDDKDRIWMGTNRGISMLNESRTSFTNYDPSDGLQGLVFSESSSFRTHDGYFCYGGINGFNMFKPDSLKKNLFIPPVVLTGITIFDQPLKSSYSNLRTLRLTYKQNFFTFEFAALSYDHPEKNQYACQLIPFDEKMVQLGTNHSISYTNVPPGHYTLKVKASNNDRVWNYAGYELKLTIIPPFWATWWFRSIVIISFIGAVLLFFKLRENRIKKEQIRQTAINKQIAELRMTALQTQMNPHFIFNSLNSIQHLISIREKQEAINYLSKFSRLIRRILENSVMNSVSVNNELELLELYMQLEQLRFNNKFEYHITVDEKIDRENTGIPPLLIQPYVENAILHGLTNKDGKGHLSISVEKNDGLLVCKIEDDGIGRARAQEIEQKKIAKHKSMGMKVTSDRISTISALLDSKMEVAIEDLFEENGAPGEERQSAGTRVTISIPTRDEE